MMKKTKGKRPSPKCKYCSHHPTKRLYIKKDNAFKGFAWFCPACDKVMK